MVESTYTTRVLTAAEGHFLTQANLENVEGAVISTKVYLAVNDAPENWKEITAEEAEAIKAEQEKISEERRKELEPSQELESPQEVAE